MIYRGNRNSDGWPSGTPNGTPKWHVPGARQSDNNDSSTDAEVRRAHRSLDYIIMQFSVQLRKHTDTQTQEHAKRGRCDDCAPGGAKPVLATRPYRMCAVQLQLQQQQQQQYESILLIDIHNDHTIIIARGFPLRL